MKKFRISSLKSISSNNWLILIILFLAAFLRLYRIQDYMTFLGDEGRDVLVVYNILHGDFTLLGPTASVGGFFLGPIYYYFMVPFLFLFNYNPVGPAIMVALFGITTVWLVYTVGKEILDKNAGLIAASLYAFSPIVIAYSRSSWNPNLMPFFSILILLLLYKSTIKNNTKIYFLIGILLGLLIQLHYLATFVGLIIFLYILLVTLLKEKTILSRAVLLLKKYTFIFIGFIIGWLPFLAFEFRHGFLNLKSIMNFVFNSGDTGGNIKLFPTITDVFFRLFGRLIARFPSPEQILSWSSLNIIFWHYLILIMAILSVGFLIYKTFKMYKENNEKFYGLLLLLMWFLIGILLFGFYKKSIYDYYFGFMFFVPFLILGNFLSYCFSNKYLKIISLICLVFLLWFNFEGRPSRFPANKQLNQAEEISRFVYEKADGKPFNFALITPGNSDHAYRYFFKLWGNYPKTIENIENDPQRKTVTDQLLVVCERQCAPLGNSLWEVAGFGRAEIAGLWDVSVVAVYKLIHYKKS